MKNQKIRLTLIIMISISILLSIIQITIIYLCSEGYTNDFPQKLFKNNFTSFIIRIVIKSYFVFKLTKAYINKKELKMSIRKYILICILLLSSLYETWNIFSYLIPISNIQTIFICTISILLISIVINILLVIRVIIYTYIVIVTNKKRKNNENKLQKLHTGENDI